MTRGFSDCCHYDEGYDDGYADAEDKHGGERGAIVSALRLLASEARLRGEDTAGETLDRTADRLTNDQGFERRMEIEHERQARLAKLYAEQRQEVA